MIDLQNSTPNINLPLQQVGIKDLKYPAKISLSNHPVQNTIANFKLTTDLAANNRGTHMSRFIEVLNEQDWIFSTPALTELLQVLLSKLEAENASIALNFTWFISKQAPVSKKIGLMDYDITLKATGNIQTSTLNFIIKIPVNTLCPCSKAISKYNAHNQRAIITLDLELKNDNIDINQLIMCVESQASSPIYSVLKRADEKYVTEQAYENPVFVEDLARKTAMVCHDFAAISFYTISVENIESIHNHCAFAKITNKKQL